MKSKQGVKPSPKKGAKQPSERPVPKPDHKWEKDGYQRDQTIKFMLPCQFLYLCKLAGVKPDEVLHHFMDDLGQESWKRSENPGVRQTLIEYFILRGWGQDFYSETDIRKMFAELDAIGSLWPENAKMKQIDRHAKWRDKYHRYWFKKWYYKVRRKKP